MVDLEKLEQAMVDLDEQAVLAMMQAVAGGDGDASAALEACQRGMEKVGALFEEGEYFIADLIFCGEVMDAAISLVKPLLAGGGGEGLGRLVIATVRDDLHDIGKNIVKTMLEASGFEVIDLGVNVSPEAIVQCVRDSGARIVALSGLLSLAIEAMKDTVDGFVEAGLRDDVRIIIGGNPVNADTCALVGADDWTHSPHTGVNICKAWAAEA